MAGGTKSKHEAEILGKVDHVNSGAHANGQCLSPHQSVYKKNNSCSYRWQGVKKAKEHPEIYDAHRGFGGRPAKKYHLGETNDVIYASTAFAGNTFGDVLRSFTSKKKKIPLIEIASENFTQGAMPYANQVHHILPCAELRNGLDSVVKDVRTIEHVCNSLLKEKYNLNKHINMIILPEGPRHAKEIGLPMHPNNHTGYSEQLAAMIESALSNVEKVKEEGEDHPPLDYAKIKKNFEKISNAMYRTLAKPGVTPRHSIFGKATDIADWSEFPEINF